MERALQTVGDLRDAGGCEGNNIIDPLNMGFYKSCVLDPGDIDRAGFRV